MRKVLAWGLLATLMLGAAPCGDDEGDGDGDSAEGEGSAAGAAGESGSTATPGDGGDNEGGAGDGDREQPATTPTEPAEGDRPGDGNGDGDSVPGTPPEAGDGDLGDGDGDPGDDGEGDTTGTTDDAPSCELECGPGQHCELVEVTCVRAPCPPSPQCVDSPFCGGFAGFTCEGEGSCEDDPRDDCDPRNGGADCGGVCVCPAEGTCGDGQVWDSNPKVCGCVRAGGDTGAGGGERCGDNTCGRGMVCCNASCGICTPPDAACIQIACD